MAQVSYVDLITAQKELYWRSLQPGDRYSFSRVRKKIALLSRRKKAGVSERSLLPQCSDAWALFTEEQKTAWSSAGGQTGLNGWRLFVKDKCLRIKNDLAGNSTPDLLHQALVGKIHIESPATSIKITQIHPRNYYVYKKIYGTKSQYQPVLITEDLALPFTLSLNYKADLEASGDNPSAKFYARFWYSYQGRNLQSDLEIPLDYFCDWQYAEAVLTSLISIVIRYDLYFELTDLQGDLYFDNVKAEHSGQNWVRDTYCNDINQGFTKNYYQIPKHWAGVNVPDGTYYESVFEDFA